MSDPARKVTCETHGEGIATFVCRHLSSGVCCGYHASGEDPLDQWPDAWCSACEEVWQREGEWNDVSEGFADIKMLCNGCYDEARLRNARLPGPLAPSVGRLDPSSQEALERAGCRWTSDTQSGARAQWNFQAYSRWSWLEAEGKFAFEDDDLGKLHARVRVVGTFSTADNSWLWGWANDNLEAAATRDVSRLKVFGEVRGISNMVEPHLAATVEDAWHLASVAAYLLDAELVYRVPMGPLSMFMLLDQLTLRPDELADAPLSS